MRIAVASGKGGTGKTTVATSLALSLAQCNPAAIPPLFLDCDVEAPNAHLFLKPAFDERRDVGILIPKVDEGRCTHCGRCADVCQYHAIAVLGKTTLVFEQLCHGCGSCTLMCPEKAISETPEVMGMIERGIARSGIHFARGVMNVGEPMAVPVIRELRRWATPLPGQVTIVDVAPGASCPVVEAVRGADYLLLVTEPTPFGLHDLRLAVQVAVDLDMPVGVVINRDNIGDTCVNDFCANENLPVVMRIPYERVIAEGVARGQTLIDIHPDLALHFTNLIAYAQAAVAYRPAPSITREKSL